ncbi:MAG TPA: SDR family NAD(P)-dependent oxidoreductase, partial [Flavisolibacter sp.]|nr:SDR family NAD(P)-dependent oxidoreductase [Flavisolibacter sp.]
MKLYSEINIGDVESLKHKITQSDIAKFVDLTGDDNKLHVDEAFARTTAFKKPVAHGMLGASFISTIIGTKLPGDGALWFSQTLEFLLPVRIGDELTVTAQVVKKSDKDQIIELAIDIKNQDRQVVTKGLAKVKVVEIRKETEAVPTLERKQKTALVIGGTGGIGRAVCKQLAQDGFHVFVHYFSNKSLAETLRADITSGGGKATIIKADVTKAGDVNDLYRAFERYADSLDILINCPSIKIPKISFKELQWADFNEQINFHVKAVFEVSKIFISLLGKARSGKIINIGTLAADRPNADWAHYITAKAALFGLTKAMAFELGPKGISVNMVSPGLTDTELTADIPEKIKLIT